MSLPPGALDGLLARVADADAAARAAWPRRDHAAADEAAARGRGGRQPVHTVYVPADRFAADTAARWGEQAATLLRAHAARPGALAAATGVAPDLADAVHARVRAKLDAEPVEDLRIDFEDGYLGHDDRDEDRDATAAGRAVAAAAGAGALPGSWGLRVKPFCDGLAARSVRTLDRFLAALLDGGAPPAGMLVTFPKIVAVEHVDAFVEALALLEDAHGLAAGSLRFEVQVETTQSLVGPDGRGALRGVVDAGGPRLAGAAFGVYDYTAALGLPPWEQRLDHPACDHARHVLQVTLAGTGLRLSDGASNAVPADASAAEVRRVWARHAADVRHGLLHGFWQGWDMHPAHLVSRFAAAYAFLLPQVDDARERLARWRAGAAGGGTLDEPATVRALTALLRRAADCGALAGDDGGASAP